MKTFENLKYNQLKILLEVVNGTSENGIDVIRKRYHKSTNNFKGAVNFLIEVNVLKESKDKLLVKKSFKFSGNSEIIDDDLKGQLLKKLLISKSKATISVLKYLEKFKAVNRGFEYKPLTVARIKESSLRNFLIELGLIEYIIGTGTYQISDKHFDVFELFLKQKKLTVKELKLIVIRKEELGNAAELEILKYEMKRLVDYPELVKRIEHRAMHDVRAGYDILSWEKESHKEGPLVRYVEVKAVSKIDYGFYWTRNEIKKAKKFENRYYLYLLPVIGKNKFDIDSLIIIANPIMSVFDNAKLWCKEVETYSFKREIN